jgi:hypothetical protein
MIGLVIKPGFIKPAEDTIKEVSPEVKLTCIDLGYLSRRTKSDPKLMMEMISLYLEQTPPLIKLMKQSFRDKDWISLYAAVHKMIPSFSIVGISENFENMAKKVQVYASSQQHADEMTDMVLQIELVCTQACNELKQEFDTIKNTTP